MGAITGVFLILITIFVPPVGVAIVAGCGVDLLINILLTVLGYFPGHIHAFYLEYIYYKRRDEARAGIYNARPASGIYSDRVQRGGKHVRQVQPLPQTAPLGHSSVSQGPGIAPPPPGYGTV